MEETSFRPTSIEIRPSDPNAVDAVSLIDELSETLARITGRDGRDSFSNSDVIAEPSLFLIAYQNGQAVGCGALRPINDTNCEIKRMFVRLQNKGIGKSILVSLEKGAFHLGYQRILLETGVQNQTAINFYLKNGYSICGNYGKYQGRRECICFEKEVTE